MSELHHEMNITETYPSQVEQWECPHCGYRMILQWHPFKRIPLQLGDETVAHSASKGGLTIKSVNIEAADDFPVDLKNQLNDILNKLD